MKMVLLSKDDAILQKKRYLCKRKAVYLPFEGKYQVNYILVTMKRILMLMTAMVMVLGLSAQSVKVMNLWPKGAPNRSGMANDTAKVWIYLPADKKATGRAIVICPGGGYSGLAMDHEGHEWARFFQNMGIAAFVLKYRMPNGNPEVPISDAEETIKMVRRNAMQWHIKSNEVGIMGSSAGGHLASIVATLGERTAKPNFQILFYPVITMMSGFTHQGSHDNFLGRGNQKRKEKNYSSDMQVTRNTPRAWIALSDDDTVVPPSNGSNYYLELYRHDVPASLHVYPDGGHGWGSRLSFKYHIEMIMELKAWLDSF